MQGIGPGTILGGRYAAQRRAAQYRDAELWTARDSTLERDVLLFVISTRHPNVDAVLDAARRVGGLENARLSRILDVDTDDGLAYVVEEALEGSHTLAELLDAGPLPAPEVRRIAGEASLVLDIARHRGLHHQQLTPELVVRTPDGDIKVRGLATMAALVGTDDLPHADATRTDATAVVALAYAGFTGLWPLPGDRGGLPPAPSVAGRVAAPSEIAAGVPADLDTLCRQTLSEGHGPSSPGDFARQIAPWSPIPVLLPAISQSQPPLGSGGPTDGRGSRSRPATDTDTARPRPTAARVPESQAPEDGAPAADPAVTPLVAHRVPTPAAKGKPRIGPPAASAAPPAAMSAATAPATSRPAGTPDLAAAAAAAGSAGPSRTGGAPAPLGPSPLATVGTKTAAALGAAGAATAGAAKSVSERIGTWSSGARQKARAAAEARRARREQAAQDRTAPAPPSGSIPPAETRVGAESARVPASGESAATTGVQRAVGAGGAAAVTTREPVDDTLEPPLPLLPPSAAEPLTRDQSRMAIGIIVGFLVLAFGFALWGLSQIPALPGFSDGSATSAPSPTPTPTATGEDGATGSEDTPGTATPGTALTFVGAVDFDPLGDGAERPEEVARILDGDASTSWTSEGYRSASFSNLKAGVGVVLDLGRASTISEVTLELPLAANGSIYVTDDERFFADRPPIGDDMQPAGAFSGQGTVSTPLAAGTQGRYVIVWFTEASREGDWFRTRLAGATATS